jgi:Sulfatase/TAT (twin-arginine translocation) pathway signal sequence
MKRRDFLKTSAAVTGGSLLNELGVGKLLAQTQDGTEVSGPRPNILFLLVDELRFPSVFPKGVKDAGEFLCKFMPNLYCLWQRGVKFGNHHTAANACTPSRGVLITGLYSQQNWLISTILASDPFADRPVAAGPQPRLPHLWETPTQNGLPHTVFWQVARVDPGGSA